MSDRLAQDLALVLVGQLDRRVLPALSFAASLPNYELKAVHVSVDAAASRALATDWMELDLGWVPLHIEDAEDGSLLASVRSVVEREVADRRRLLVIVPEMDLDRWWQSLLHRSTGRRVARRLHALRRVSTVVVPFPTELARTAPPRASCPTTDNSTWGKSRWPVPTERGTSRWTRRWARSRRR
jgi:hypothetical protein